MILLALFFVFLINEFTLIFFDDTPPLSESAVFKIRLFNFCIIIFACSFKLIIPIIFKFLNFTYFFIINYLLNIFIAIIILDLTLRLFGFGYPSHYNQENIERFPSPYDTFTGRPLVRDHNEFGFRGDFRINTFKSYNIAIFGGSTAYNGSPPIIDLVANNLISQGILVKTYNFGSVASNHSQHVHRLIKFSDIYKLDLVIFYGGYNETINYTVYDPRPGYPYNFFFRNELSPWKQAMLQSSSILGAFDQYSGGVISGLYKLKKEHLDVDWDKDIITNYWRDLRLASSISQSIVKPNVCNKTQFLSFMQPANPSTVPRRNIWNKLASSQKEIFNNINWRHVDFTKLSSSIEFIDDVHVTQQSRELIAKNLTGVVNEILSIKCLF